MDRNLELVKDFIAAWNRYDLDAVEAMVTPDIVYHNIPMEPCIGRVAFRNFIDSFKAASATWETHSIAATGNSVLTERTDKFVFGDGSTMTIRVMGAFEIAGGKITKWRDYFDPAEAVPRRSS
jgi:limonene-1,2-epoxide hydrolase